VEQDNGLEPELGSVPVVEQDNEWVEARDNGLVVERDK
jgi:hypothetical protein